MSHMEILDIHTHHEAPQPNGVVAFRIGGGFEAPALLKEQLYSTGVHPWDTLNVIFEEEWKELETLVAKPQIVAIGECGIDLTPHGGPLFRQLQTFKRQVEISEKAGKPLVIHDVKGHDILAGARRDLKPKQNWAIHGFRRKPEVAAMLLRAGCYLSFGAEFNPDTLRSTPEDRILAETDESTLSIRDVIARLSEAYGKDLTPVIAVNSRRFLGFEVSEKTTKLLN